MGITISVYKQPNATATQVEIFWRISVKNKVSPLAVVKDSSHVLRAKPIVHQCNCALYSCYPCARARSLFVSSHMVIKKPDFKAEMV